MVGAGEIVTMVVKPPCVILCFSNVRGMCIKISVMFFWLVMEGFGAFAMLQHWVLSGEYL